MSTKDEESSPLISQRVKADITDIHGGSKRFRIFMGLYMLLFVICVAVLSYDHFKYGPSDPPTTQKHVFRFFELLLLALVFVFVGHMFYIMYKLSQKGTMDFAGFWYIGLFLLLIISSVYWAYYHFSLAPAYYKTSSPTSHQKKEYKLYSIAKWTSIISMTLLMISLCMGAGGFLESYFCFKMIGELLAAFAN